MVAREHKSTSHYLRCKLSSVRGCVAATHTHTHTQPTGTDLHRNVCSSVKEFTANMGSFQWVSKSTTVVAGYRDKTTNHINGPYQPESVPGDAQRKFRVTCTTTLCLFPEIKDNFYWNVVPLWAKNACMIHCVRFWERNSKRYLGALPRLEIYSIVTNSLGQVPPDVSFGQSSFDATGFTESFGKLTTRRQSKWDSVFVLVCRHTRWQVSEKWRICSNPLLLASLSLAGDMKEYWYTNCAPTIGNHSAVIRSRVARSFFIGALSLLVCVCLSFFCVI